MCYHAIFQVSERSNRAVCWIKRFTIRFTQHSEFCWIKRFTQHSDSIQRVLLDQTFHTTQRLTQRLNTASFAGSNVSHNTATQYNEFCWIKRFTIHSEFCWIKRFTQHSEFCWIKRFTIRFTKPQRSKRFRSGANASLKQAAEEQTLH